MLQPGRHRDMEMNSFEVDDIDEKTRQLRWWNRAIGTMVSSSPNKLHVAWKVPTNLGGLPLLGYNIYCRRLRTYIPPLDQTIEGREEERKRMAQLRKEIDDSSSANGTLGSGYQGECEQTKHTVQPEELSVTVDQLWPACIYLVAIIPFSMLGEGAASPWQEMQTGEKDGGCCCFRIHEIDLGVQIDVFLTWLTVSIDSLLLLFFLFFFEKQRPANPPHRPKC